MPFRVSPVCHGLPPKRPPTGSESPRRQAVLAALLPSIPLNQRFVARLRAFPQACNYRPAPVALTLRVEQNRLWLDSESQATSVRLCRVSITGSGGTAWNDGCRVPAGEHVPFQTVAHRQRPFTIPRTRRVPVAGLGEPARLSVERSRGSCMPWPPGLIRPLPRRRQPSRPELRTG